MLFKGERKDNIMERDEVHSRFGRHKTRSRQCIPQLN